MSSASIGSGAHAAAASCISSVIPVVAALLHVDRETRRRLALHDHDDVLDRRRVLQRFVGRLLERHDLAAPIAAVGGDEHRACASLMRSRSDSALKPPKTTLCTAPMRAQASIAIASSGISGR